ncbi:MAG: pyruvate dehydrogenase (acetyl-transferring), homodimeric type [Chloroflexota bacterium]
MREADPDPVETLEWLQSLDSVWEREGAERAHQLIDAVIRRARGKGDLRPWPLNTPYLNTLPASTDRAFPGNDALEARLQALIRWNALALILGGKRAPGGGLGGHIASYASIATLYEIGFNHFFRAPTADRGGDLVYFQGHSAEGVYARAFLEGRISVSQMQHFRQESQGGGLSSYPHPWLMPDFWQFATVSMGLGPLQAIYQARFMKYLQARGLAETGERKVWCFIGDGETDEPETLGALQVAARENLDNLIFVVNCNLQRLDGPVRGNGKIIQELEARFLGSGWNVIKVIWSARWDPLLNADRKGRLRRRMEEAVDGLYQACSARGGGYLRERFFAQDPELREMVAAYSDDELARLDWGGHDARKVFAAYDAATRHRGQPSVVIAKTVKGYGMGRVGQGQNTAHQQEELGEGGLQAFRDRFDVPIPEGVVKAVAFYRPPADSPEMQYLRKRREALGGPLPARRRQGDVLQIPPLAAFQKLLDGSGEREASTTMVFVRMLQMLLRDKTLGPRVVPIVPDEARTFGMEGMFRPLGIYSAVGQLYEPPDAGQLASYREDRKGQILEEGITESGAMSSWIAAATAYSTHGVSMIPFLPYYSMFGFQRMGDLCWAAADMRARGFLLGGTSGRTTLNGEGLQHEDGHSHVLYSVVPTARCYDPTFGYELVTIIHDGLERLYTEQQDGYYYLTIMNENYPHPPMPDGVTEGIVKGMYRLKAAPQGHTLRVQLLGSGTILQEVIAAAQLLASEWAVGADIWSVPSFTELRREGLEVERWNRLHPGATKRTSYVTQCLQDQPGPVIAATDYIRTYAEQIRAFVPAPYHVLGTDGFGRSDTRARLRQFFEVDRHWIVVSALHGLAEMGEVPPQKVAAAMQKYGISADKPNPAKA